MWMERRRRNKEWKGMRSTDSSNPSCFVSTCFRLYEPPTLFQILDSMFDLGGGDLGGLKDRGELAVEFTEKS